MKIDNEEESDRERWNHRSTIQKYQSSAQPSIEFRVNFEFQKMEQKNNSNFLLFAFEHFLHTTLWNIHEHIFLVKYNNLIKIKLLFGNINLFFNWRIYRIFKKSHIERKRRRERKRVREWERKREIERDREREKKSAWVREVHMISNVLRSL